MVQLLAGDPYTNSNWLVSLAELPGVYWSQSSSIGASANRGSWADPLSGIRRFNQSGAIEYDPITLSKPFMKADSQGETNNWSVIRDNIIIWFHNGTNLSGALSPVVRGNGIELIGRDSIQLENMKIRSFNFPGDIDIGDGATTSMITVEMSIEYINAQ